MCLITNRGVILAQHVAPIVCVCVHVVFALLCIIPSFEKIWTRNNMDQNNDGPEQLWTFWDFFFLWTYFSGPTHVWGFFVLVQNFDDRLCGEKARNGSTGPTYKPRCPANVRYRKLGMGLPGHI